MDKLEKRIKMLEIKQGDWIYNPHPKDTPANQQYKDLLISRELHKLEIVAPKQNLSEVDDELI
jgi:hypothetical protein